MSEDVSVTAATPAQGIKWVQLMNRLPSHINPLNDQDGSFADLGDIGKIHYIAGTLGGEVQRTFEVDLGDTLVLPMINTWEWIQGDYDNLKDAALGWLEFLNPQEAYLRIDLNTDPNNEGDFEVNLNFDDLDGSTYFPELNIEGQASEFYVESGEEFKFSNPKHNINNDIPPGVYDAYAAGYWAQIDNLPEGTHRIEFGGTFAPEGYDPIYVSVTDIITVVDPSSDYLM